MYTQPKCEGVVGDEENTNRRGTLTGGARLSSGGLDQGTDRQKSEAFVLETVLSLSPLLIIRAGYPHTSK